MNSKRCVMCGKDMAGEDEFTETCYGCQEKSLDSFPLIAKTLNKLLLEIDVNEELPENVKRVTLIAIYEAVKFFGEAPAIEVPGADEYLDDTDSLIRAINSLINKLEELDESEETAWTIYSLIHAVKEYGGTPSVEFFKSKHGSEITL